MPLKCANALDTQKGGEIRITGYPGERILADMLTKALNQGLLEKLILWAMGTYVLSFLNFEFLYLFNVLFF